MPQAQTNSIDRDAPYVSTLERLLALPATDVQVVLRQASDLVSEALDADKVDTFLYDPAIDTLVAVGTSDTPMGRRQHRLGLNRMALTNGGICVQVFKTGVPCRTGRADQDPQELRGVTEGLGVRSVLAVPLDVDGTRRGVLQTHCAQPDKFTAGDLSFLESVARWIAMVLHRAELVERITHDAADKARRMAAEELLTILAHDLRGPLTPLRGYLGLIRQEVVRAELPASTRYAEASLRAVDRLQGMIVNLLDSARLEQGIFGLERQTVDVARVARETARGLETADAPIHVRGPAVVLLDADPERIRQVLENLLGNARKHSPAGAEIDVEVAREQREDGSWAVLTVRDTGPGIPPEFLPRLFTRFARGDESQGLGLGLYLARGIAEAHGGTLIVDSLPGHGTAFRFALPGADATHGSTPL